MTFVLGIFAGLVIAMVLMIVFVVKSIFGQGGFGG